MNQNRNLFRLTRFILFKLPYVFRFLRWFSKQGGAQRLLIIKTDAIGDYILFRNFIEQLKRSAKYNNYEIDLLGNEIWKDIALTYDSRFVSDFNFIKPSQFYYKPGAVFKMGWQLFKKNYEVVLNPSSTRVLISDGLAALCAAKQTIGFESDDEGMQRKYKAKTDKFYTPKLLLPPAIYHEFHRNKFFFHQVTGDHIEMNKPIIQIKSATKAGIIIFPGASVKKRCWEIEKFITLIKLIQEQSTETIYLAGGQDETAVNNLIYKTSSGSVTDITGQTTLPQLIEKIASSLLVISNDSSAVHMAVAVNTPSFCITGGGHFNRFVPYPKDFINGPVCVYQKMDCYYCNWNCIYQTNADERYPCISNVTVEMAWRALQPLL